MDTKLPPAAIEAEQALLGGILFDPKRIADIKQQLPVEAFFVGSHQTIYQSMIDVSKLGYEPDLIHLVRYMNDRDVLDTVGGNVALSRLLSQTVSASNCDRYIKLILEKWERRKLISLGYQIAELGEDSSQSLNDIYQEIKELLPEAVTEVKPEVNEPKITRANYTVFSRSGQKKLELEADVTDNDRLADSIATVAAKAKLIAELLWGEDLK